MLEVIRKRIRHLKNEVFALYLAYRDPRVPWYAKIAAACVVAYAFSPIDLIPDFIPVLGYLDDLILVPLGVALTIRLIPVEVMNECRSKAQAVESINKEIGYFGMVFIVVIWIVVMLGAIIWLLERT